MKQRDLWLLAGVLALASATIKPAHAAAPTSPAMPEATPGNGVVLLTFTTIPNAASYNIYRRTADQTADQIAKVGNTGSGFFIDTGLTNGTNLYYSVKAVDSAGSEGVASDPVLVMPQVPIGPGLVLHYLESNPAILPATVTVDTANDVLTIRANGEDLWDDKDSGDFLAMPVAGDYSISFEVLEKPVAEDPNTSNNVKVGPMIRDSLIVGSRYAFLQTTSGRGVLWERREAFLGNNGSPATGTGAEGTAGTDDSTTTYPLWLKLTKTGAVIAASQSTDGTNYTQEGDETTTTDFGRMNPVTYAGIASISSNIDGYGHSKVKLSSIKINYQ
jgi:hypothetical protein